MQIYTIKSKKSQNSKKAIFFFTGWGMDETPFLTMQEDNYDVIIFYNYTTTRMGNECTDGCCLETELSECKAYALLSKYDEINIVAWSMGVWAASNVFEKYLTKIKETNHLFHSARFLRKLKHCIAINGTLLPIGDFAGIPKKIVDGTIKNLPQGINKFYLRMCGSKKLYEKFLTIKPKRDLEEIKQELITIRNTYGFCCPFKWTKVYISKNDNIFPFDNQTYYWEIYISGGGKVGERQKQAKSFKIITLDKPHYPFDEDNFKLSSLF